MITSIHWMSKGQWLLCYDFPKRKYKAWTSNARITTILFWALVSTLTEIKTRGKRWLQKSLKKNYAIKAHPQKLNITGTTWTT